MRVEIGAYCEVAKNGQKTWLWERGLMVHPTQDNVRWVAHKQLVAGPAAHLVWHPGS